MPNGQYFAVLSPVNGRLNLVVIDLATKKTQALMVYDDFDVHWVGNERLV